MRKCIDSLLVGGEDVEILVVNDGSTKDCTAEIADEYAEKYPTIVKAIHKENGGHAQNKGPVLRLMPDGVHADETSDAAAEGSSGEKGGLRDAPKIFSGFLLVRKHKQEPDGIDYKQVEQDKFSHNSSFGRDGYVIHLDLGFGGTDHDRLCRSRDL